MLLHTFSLGFLNRCRSPIRAVLVVIGGATGAIGLKAEPIATPSQFAQLEAHPRLFANATRWRELQTQIVKEPISAELATAVIARADHVLTQPLVAYEKTGRRMLAPVREGLSRILVLSMAARLTEETRYSDRAIREMQVAAALPDWNPSHFLDTAEMTFGLAVGYDWLFERIVPADRARFERAIIEKGLQASYPAEGPAPGWIKANNNWTQVCHASLVAGAIATGTLEPELSARVLQRALDNLPGAARFSYEPDGAYPEGPSYWIYGTAYHVILADLLTHAFGSAMGTDAYPGFLETAHYLNQMTSPSGRFFNYADGEERRGFVPPLFWFARRMHDRSVVEREILTLSATLEHAKGGHDDQATRFTPLALLWWSPALGNVSPKNASAETLSWCGRGRTPVSVHRSAWGDPRALFVGIKGGPIDASHAHMDLGSFVIEARGIRWAVDLGAQDYPGLEARGIDLWNYRQDADRWKVFRLGPEAHNILRFNGQVQDVRANATMVDFAGRESDQHTTLDLSSAYPRFVSAVRRTVKLEGKQSIVISDTWSTGAEPVDVAWQWLTRAEPTITSTGVTLKEAGETLCLRVAAPTTGWSFSVEDTEKLLRPYDEPNPGLKRLVLHTRSPARSEGHIIVVVETASQK